MVDYLDYLSMLDSNMINPFSHTTEIHELLYKLKKNRRAFASISIPNKKSEIAVKQFLEHSIGLQHNFYSEDDKSEGDKGTWLLTPGTYIKSGNIGLLSSAAIVIAIKLDDRILFCKYLPGMWAGRDSMSNMLCYAEKLCIKAKIPYKWVGSGEFCYSVNAILEAIKENKTSLAYDKLIASYLAKKI